MKSAKDAISEFAVGALVTLGYPQNQDGVSKPPSKLLTKRSGPYVILSVAGPIYTIRNSASNKTTSVHISRLEQFMHDPGHTDPMAVAAKDMREFIVEAILDHEPKSSPAKHKKTLQFLVKWKGYDESENSWVSWHKNLSNNSICLAHCMRNGMRTMVDKKYRADFEG